jgi:SAM-dependent methyltransferase
MPEPNQRPNQYALGHSPQELDRLAFQAKILEPFTRTFFEQAGVGTGMSVLDVGSGAGDVVFLVRQLVGAEGRVTGTDRAPEALERARKRADALGYSNVTFVQGDPAEMTFDEPFDAIVGRFVLMYYRDPVETLRRLARHVRLGGILAFQDSDNAGRTYPLAPMFDRSFELMGKALELSGVVRCMGPKLYPSFIAAGLPAPTLIAHIGVVGSQDPAVDQLSEFIVTGLRPMMPAIVKHGLATEKELDIETYAQRMAKEFRAGGGILTSPLFIGAWARKASD